MNQISLHKDWAVLEDPTVCTNWGVHEHYTGTGHQTRIGYGTETYVNLSIFDKKSLRIDFFMHKKSA